MANYSRVTLGQLQSLLTARLGNNSTFWTLPEMTSAINEALNVWQLMVGEWTLGISIVANGSVFYTIPSQIASIQRVLFNGTSLTMGSVNEFDLGNPGWQGISGTPTFWAINGLNLISLSPQPTSGTITIEGITETPVLINTADYVMLGDEQLNRILDYSEHYCSFKEGAGEFDNAQTGFSLFIQAAGKRNGNLLTTALYRQYMGRNREEQGRYTDLPSKEGAR